MFKDKIILYMIKKFVLTAFATLIASMIALAQTEPAPSATSTPANKTERAGTAKSTKDADKVQHAEERSKGAAFSGKGKGKGGDKNTVDKDKKGKKDKKKGKKNGKSKGKSKDKAKRNSNGEGNDDDNDGMKKAKKSQQPAEQKRRQERTGGDKTPAPTTPAPSEQKSRKAGDKPAPGTENPKG